MQSTLASNTKAAASDISFKRMTKEDVPEVIALARAIWRAHYPGIISHDQIEYMLEKNYGEQTLNQQLEDKQYTLLAENGSNNIVGYISIKEENDPGCYFISRLYVDPAQHGGGIGARLLERAIHDHAPVNMLSLNVNRQNIKAVNFYFRQGFTIAYCMDTDFGGGYFMNDFRMVRRLDGRRTEQ